MTSIIILFELVHLYDIGVKGVLKSLTFVVQKANAPKTGIEFHQGSIGAIKSSLATSYDAARRRAMSPWELDTEWKKEKKKEKMNFDL